MQKKINVDNDDDTIVELSGQEQQVYCYCQRTQSRMDCQLFSHCLLLISGLPTRCLVLSSAVVVWYIALSNCTMSNWCHFVSIAQCQGARSCATRCRETSFVAIYARTILCESPSVMNGYQHRKVLLADVVFDIAIKSDRIGSHTLIGLSVENQSAEHQNLPRRSSPGTILHTSHRSCTGWLYYILHCAGFS